MANAYKTTHSRGANAVDAQPQRLASADGRKWALGRNVKAESPRGAGYYDVVEVWTLKYRHYDGRIEITTRSATRDEANAWTNGSIQPTNGSFVV